MVQRENRTDIIIYSHKIVKQHICKLLCLSFACE